MRPGSFAGNRLHFGSRPDEWMELPQPITAVMPVDHVGYRCYAPDACYYVDTTVTPRPAVRGERGQAERLLREHPVVYGCAVEASNPQPVKVVWMGMPGTAVPLASTPMGETVHTTVILTPAVDESDLLKSLRDELFLLASMSVHTTFGIAGVCGTQTPVFSEWASLCADFPAREVVVQEGGSGVVDRMRCVGSSATNITFSSIPIAFTYSPLI